MSGYRKPRVVCPFCERDNQTLANGQPKHFTTNGMTAHVRANHPGDYEDWHTNKDKYVASHSCDDNGALIKGGSPQEGSFPEPAAKSKPDDDDEEEYYIVEEPDDDDEPEPKPKSDPEPEPKKPGFFRSLALDLGFTDD